MANSNAPQGMLPVRHRNGAPYNGACNSYVLPAAVANAFIGDPVLVNGTSSVTGASGTLIPQAVLATAGAGNFVTGVIVGFEPTGALGTFTNYSPTGTDRVALVCDDPDVIFEVQASAGFAVTDMSNNADLVAGAGSTSTGTSGWQADSTTFGTGNTKQLKVLRMAQRPNTETGTNAKLEVEINLHSQRNPLGV